MPKGNYIRRDVNLCFFDKVQKTDSCWIWTGAKNQLGYGVFRNQKAHRFSFEISKGVIPNSIHVCHSCDNPACVNPDHLFLGTPKINASDRNAKSRQARGEMFGSRVKLTANQVVEIRSINGESHASIAKRFGVSQTTITAVINKKTWKHL